MKLSDESSREREKTKLEISKSQEIVKMKKVNSIVITTIVATFVISMFAFQPATTEASNNVSPSATPSPRKIRKMPGKSFEVENDETHLTRKSKTKVKTKRPAYKEGGLNTTTHRTRKPIAKNNGWYNLPEVDDEVIRKRRTTKSSKNEVSIETLERRKQTRKRKN